MNKEEYNIVKKLVEALYSGEETLLGTFGESPVQKELRSAYKLGEKLLDEFKQTLPTKDSPPSFRCKHIKVESRFTCEAGPAMIIREHSLKYELGIDGLRTNKLVEGQQPPPKGGGLQEK